MLAWWFIGWILIGAIVAWLVNILWRHPQGCVWDGAVAIVGALTGAIVYGAIAGVDRLLAIDIFSLIAAVLVALLALAVTRAFRPEEEPAHTETTGPGDPMGIGKDTEPGAGRSRSERPADGLGHGPRAEEAQQDRPEAAGVEETEDHFGAEAPAEPVAEEEAPEQLVEVETTEELHPEQTPTEPGEETSDTPEAQESGRGSSTGTPGRIAPEDRPEAVRTDEPDTHLTHEASPEETRTDEPSTHLTHEEGSEEIHAGEPEHISPEDRPEDFDDDEISDENDEEDTGEPAPR